MRVWGAPLLLVLGLCALANAYLYNYCQAPLPRYIPPGKSNTELVQVSVFTRHGDRSPTMPFPSEDVEWACGATDEVEITGAAMSNIGPLKLNVYIDPNNPFANDLWSGNCTAGQLTSKGATQSYLLGQQLRSIYISTLHFIPSNFDPSQLFLRSSDVWRTQQSAEANLLGLYPINSRNGQTPVINITPTPIETLYGNTGACPLIAAAITNLTKSQEFMSHVSSFAPTLAKMNSVCNTTNYFGPDSSWTTLDMADNLHARVCHNLPLPCNAGTCINSTDIAALQEESNFEFMYLTGGAVQNRLAGGVFMHEVLNHINAVLNGSSTQKYAFYSGHDSSLAMILNAWNVSDGLWPPYASNLLMETWQAKSGSDLYFRMIYNGDLLSLPFCTNPQFCAFSEVMDYYNEYLRPDVSQCFATTMTTPQ